MGWIHLNVWFFKVRSAYRIPILILNNERTSYVSRSSFVSQVRLAEAAFATSSRCSSGKHIVPVRGHCPDAFTGYRTHNRVPPFPFF
jgi:hypothetical protein